MREATKDQLTEIGVQLAGICIGTVFFIFYLSLDLSLDEPVWAIIGVVFVGLFWAAGSRIARFINKKRAAVRILAPKEEEVTKDEVLKRQIIAVCVNVCVLVTGGLSLLLASEIGWTESIGWIPFFLILGIPMGVCIGASINKKRAMSMYTDMPSPAADVGKKQKDERLQSTLEGILWIMGTAASIVFLLK
jgi:hypothetical protein